MASNRREAAVAGSAYAAVGGVAYLVWLAAATDHARPCARLRPSQTSGFGARASAAPGGPEAMPSERDQPMNAVVYSGSIIRPGESRAPVGEQLEPIVHRLLERRDAGFGPRAARASS